MCMHAKFIKCPESNLGIFSPLQKFISVPCGKCDECRVSHAKEWAVRCMCEFYSYSEKEQQNCWFLTLTYSPENNPGVLCERDMRLFIKRLRSLPGVRNKIKIKYFYCGEYGSKTLRPHYHAIIYNLPLNDLVKFKNDLYLSEILNKTWGLGFVSVGFVSLQSCNYVARYALKKNTTDCFIRMSNGFGKKYFLDNMSDIVTNNYLTLPRNNKIMKCAIPRYFMKLYRDKIGDKDYSSWLKWRKQKIEEFNDKIIETFRGKDKIDYINRRRLGTISVSQELYQQSKNIINQAMYDFYHFRDFD